MERYSIINEKNPREIVLLKGLGCKWLKCRFCDYHLDSSPNPEANFVLNCDVLKQVTGCHKKLEVINSGSFMELDAKTLNEIEQTAIDKGISLIYFESHWMYKNKLSGFRNRFALSGIDVKFKIGVETFDTAFRENILKKGMGMITPEEISDAGFNEVNLLFGLNGQTSCSMEKDIETALRCFERACVNIMTKNSSKLLPSQEVINLFMEKIFPKYINNPRVDILLNNTDFGVG